MFAYLAFKALTDRYPDALRSPQQKTLWKIDPALGLPCLKAEEGTFEAGHGVYAATVEEAKGYARGQDSAVYLVAPLPGKHAVVGEEGWRAEGAVCLGPLTEENQAQIARLIVAAAANDLPQVPAILRWAIVVASKAEGRPVCPPNVDLLDLWRRGGETTWLESLLPYLDRAEDKPAIARRFIEMRDTGYRLSPPLLRWAVLIASEASGKLVMPKDVRIAELLDCRDGDACTAWLGRIAHYLSAKQLSDACESLLGASKMGLLVEARRVWLARAAPPSNTAEGEMNHRRAWEVLALAKVCGVSRCPQGLLKAAFDFAVQRRDFGWIYQLGLYCDDARWWEALRGALLSFPYPEMLYLAGRDWSDEGYTEAIAQALARRMDKEYLYLAGLCWSDKRFCEAIARAMASNTDEYGLPITDPRHLYLAGLRWPDGRFTPEIAGALIATGNAEYLYLAGRDWPDGRFTSEIAQALAKTRDARCLYLAGRDWRDGRFNEAIVQALIETADAEYLYRAGCNWPDGRYTDDILQALIRTRRPRYLYFAGCDWPDGRYDEIILRALIQTNNHIYLRRAAEEWSRERATIAKAYLSHGCCHSKYV